MRFDSETLIEIFESLSRYLLASLATLPASPSTPSAPLSSSSSPPPPPANPTPTTPKQARQTLLKTHAILHEKLALLDRIPSSEIECHLRQWSDALGILDDGLEEVGGVVESGFRPDFFGEEDSGDDDADGEDGAVGGEGGGKVKLEKGELERIKSVFMILRLGRLLVLRLINSATATLPSSPPSTTPSPPPTKSITSSTISPTPPPTTNAPLYTLPQFLNTLATTLEDLTAKTDDLASSLTDFPHDPEMISHLLTEHSEVLLRLSSTIQEESSRLSSTVQQESSRLLVGESSLLRNGDEAGEGVAEKVEGRIEGKEGEEERKWQEMFREQISKAGIKALGVLALP